jgi:hypothetical protein
MFGAIAAGLLATFVGLPTSIISAQTAIPDAVSVDGPVAYWKLDDASGTVAFDSANPPHPATYRNSVTFSTDRPSARFAGSRLFGGGACDGVEVDGSVTKIPNAVSLEAWIKPAPSSGVLLFRYRNNGYHFTLSNGRVGYSAYGGGAGIEGVRDIRDGQWHHVVAVRTNGTPSMQRIYVDGVLDTEAQAAPGPWNTQYGGFFQQGSIGRDGTACDGIVSSYRGHMAGFAIFNKALSETQVQAHYEWGRPVTVAECNESAEMNTKACGDLAIANVARLEAAVAAGKTLVPIAITVPQYLQCDDAMLCASKVSLTAIVKGQVSGVESTIETIQSPSSGPYGDMVIGKEGDRVRFPILAAFLVIDSNIDLSNIRVNLKAKASNGQCQFANGTDRAFLRINGVDPLNTTWVDLDRPSVPNP